MMIPAFFSFVGDKLARTATMANQSDDSRGFMADGFALDLEPMHG